MALGGGRFAPGPNLLARTRPRRALLQQAGLDPAATRAAPNSSSLFALLRDPRVTLILLPFDLTLRPEDATLQPVLISRNLTLWGGPEAAARAAALGLSTGATGSGADSSPGGTPGGPAPSVSPSGDGSATNTVVYVTRLDWGFAAARVKLAAGVVMVLRDVELYRAHSRISAHLDFLAASPNASLVLERIVLHRVACLPLQLALENWRTFPRTYDPPAAPAPPGGRAAPSPPPPPPAPPNSPGLWTVEGTPEASSEISLDRGIHCFVLQPADRSMGRAVAAASIRARSAAAPPAGVPVGLAICHSPYVHLRDVAYTTQLLDSMLANNGGYRLDYVNSTMVCDYEVDPACITVRGAERCLSDELAAHQADAEAAASGAGAAAAEGRGGGGSGTEPQALGLALGLGLGLGIPLLIICGLGLFCYGCRRRQHHPSESSLASLSSFWKFRRGPGFDPRPSTELSVVQEPSGPEGAAGAAAAGARRAKPEGGPGSRGGTEGGAAAGTSSSNTEPEGRQAGDGTHGRGGNMLLAGRASDKTAPDDGIGWTGMLNCFSESSRTRAANAAAAARALVPAASALSSGRGGVVGQGGSGSGSQRPGQGQRRGLEGVDEGGGFMQLEPSRVEAVRRQLAASRREVTVQILEPLGQGSFARVYKASWQGTIVALKVLVLPPSLTNDERLQQIAVMEAAVSSATSHPNLVQTYSYSFKAVLDSTHTASSRRASQEGGRPLLPGSGGAAGSSETQDARPHGYELQLVLEYCDLGTLRQALDRGAFHRGMPGATATPAGSEVGAGGHPSGAGVPGAAAATPFGGGGSPFGGSGIPEAGIYPDPSTASARVSEDVGSTMASARTIVAPPPAAHAGGLLLPPRSASEGNKPPPSQLVPDPPVEAQSGSVSQAQSPPHHAPPAPAPLAPAASAPPTPSTPAPGPAASGVPRLAAAASAPPLSAPPRPALRYSLMLALAADTASALLHLHANGIVHGDVKASNVLLKSGAGAGRTPSTGTGIAPTASTGTTAGVVTSPGISTGGTGAGSAGPAPRPTAGFGSGGGMGSGSGAGPGIGSGGAGPSVSVPAASRGPSASAAVPRRMTGYNPVARSSAGLGGGEDYFERLLPSGVVAKLSDFGLATHIDDGIETHVSALAAQGTLTHMAPELLLHGHISKHADTYAYGIMLYELLTADKAHRGQPRALLPHMVALKGLRPSFPAWAPPDYRALVESCWAAEPRKRPDFATILSELQRMRDAAAEEATRQPGTGGAVTPSGVTGPGGVLTASGWLELPQPAFSPSASGSGLAVGSRGGGGGGAGSSLQLGTTEIAALMASTVTGVTAGAAAGGSLE
ncbi:hypothetical protein HYH03_011706 [Edaphochlamys debaryana]|uniref:Protein kinase domain-containing protein n=1 Tax=Edaphochlamys debaryana TaxID=47281 RepID=A0A835Y2J4_9CHLO|nr:hypothetical protein HYH03_011706 [Edaphochlamys debaryana]|eukprot:KAG2489904.1 hypothetical protein HYH03_011706 [Edaphochlamys debaryana]